MKFIPIKIIPVKTRVMLPPKDDIYSVLDKYLPSLREGDILIITSKVLSIHQGQCVKIKKDTYEEKDKLVRKEADYYFDRKKVSHGYMLTIKDNTFVGAAGIDKSNGNGYYILWPKNVNQLLKEICQYLKKKFKLKKLAIISVDSNSTPMRLGTMGVAIGFFGLKPLKDYRGIPDIFGLKLEVTQANIVDAIAVMGNLTMGESDEKTPLAIARNLSFVEFTNRHTYKDLIIEPKEDIFYPLLQKIYKKK